MAQELEGSGLHICVSPNNCHPRVMSHSLSHLTLTTSTSSLSFTSHIFPTISPTHTRPLVHDPFYHAKSHGKVADQHKSISHRFRLTREEVRVGRRRRRDCHACALLIDFPTVSRQAIAVLCLVTRFSTVERMSSSAIGVFMRDR